MFKRWYIRHMAVNFDPDFGLYYEEGSLFGPFKAKEIPERLSDAYAEFLGTAGDKVEAFKLSRKAVKQVPFVASRAYWLEQAAEHEEYR